MQRAFVSLSVEHTASQARASEDHAYMAAPLRGEGRKVKSQLIYSGTDGCREPVSEKERGKPHVNSCRKEKSKCIHQNVTSSEITAPSVTQSSVRGTEAGARPRWWPPCAANGPTRGPTASELSSPRSPGRWLLSVVAMICQGSTLSSEAGVMPTAAADSAMHPHA